MEIYYINHSGEKIYLDRKPYYMTQEADILDYEWTYDKKYSTIYNLHKEITEKNITIAIVGNDLDDLQEKINKLFSIMEKDCVDGESGRLYYGEYFIDCIFIESSKESQYIGKNKKVLTFKVVKKSKSWLKENSTSLVYVEKQDETGHGYPYGYEYDYLIGFGCSSLIKNTHFIPCDFVLEIKGYAAEPSVTIGENTYKVNVVVNKGETLVINTKKKTITLVKTNGAVINYFSVRDRTRYFWQKIQPGQNTVYWNGEYDMVITLLEERSEPIWM